MKRIHGAILSAIVTATLACVASAAQPGPPTPRALDEQLLDELGGGPLGELDRELFGPGDQTPRPGEPSGQRPDEGETPEELQQRLRRELGAAAISEDENPLLEVSRTMREVEGRIARSDSGLTTRGLQERIVADLDTLIDQAKKKCQGSCQSPSQTPSSSQSNSNSSKPSTNPAATSTPRDATGDPAADREQTQTLMRRLWDVSLPPAQRQQLLQSPWDEFLPKYEQMIEQYFRRLAEEEDEG